MRSARHGGDFSLVIIDQRPGFIAFEAHGDAEALFADEAGGHRWQRVPENERRGRVHTSTVTVAVLAAPSEAEVRIDLSDLVIVAIRGSGPGGQARNMTANCIQVTHKPTGLQVRCESQRSQAQNKASALALLRARLWKAAQAEVDGDRAATRKAQIGSGMRGDKRRTVAVQRDQVTDHVTGQRWRISDYLKGAW